MKQFCYEAPKTVDEALKALVGADENTKIIAGGTDLIVQINKKMVSPEKVVNVKGIQELRYVKEEEGIIKIGALTSFNVLQTSELLRKKAKALAVACSEVGSPQIRSLGTIGGNIANASAAGDSIAALIALDASVVLRSEKEERIMKLEEFYQGTGNCQIRNDEILTEIFFSAPKEGTSTGFKKLGKRKALAIVVISIGALIEKDNNNICTKAQICVGAISRYPMRVREVEKLLLGKELNSNNIEKAIDMISAITEESVANSPFKHLSLYKSESVKGIGQELFDEILFDLN